MRAQVADPHGQAAHGPAGKSAFDCRPDTYHHLARDRLGLARADGHETARGQFTRGDQRGDVAIATEFTKRRERREFAAGALVQLRQGPFELGLAHYRNDEHVRRDVPWLIIDDAQPHD